MSLDETTPITEVEDRVLIRACLATALDSQAEWKELIRRYRRRVFGIAYKFTGKYEESQDLVQEIFFRVFRSLDKFDINADF